MVKISALYPYLPNSPAEFCTNPYDIIREDEEKKLKQNPKSLIHLILPDGEGEEIYKNADRAQNRFISDKIITRETKPSIFVYRQESNQFNQQGLIIGLALQDYEEGNIVKHEHTREKPLKDRTNHIIATNVAAGLVWSVYRSNDQIKELIEHIKKKEPKFNFFKYGYSHILWQETDSTIISQLTEIFKKEKVYIADGHHRAASAAEYRKIILNTTKGKEDVNAPWQFLLSYVASDDQIRILPYNRVIKRLHLKEIDFIEKLKEVYEIFPVDKPFNPKRKNQVALCMKGKWFKLEVKETNFKSKRDSLDVTIIQEQVLKPILGISNPRADENLFFVGGIQDPYELEKQVTEKGNDLVFNLFPVDIKDLEAIADTGGVMPPKSTWFDPKVLSGLVLHGLTK